MNSSYFKNNNGYEENALDSTILIEGVVWEQSHSEEPSIMEVCESDSNVLSEDCHNQALFSINENNSEYLSIMEMTNENVISDLNLASVNSSDIDEDICQSSASNEELSEKLSNVLVPPLLYKIEGSEEYLIVQVTCDSEGKLGRLQYRMSLNDDGEFEAIPGTTEVLPIDDETQEEVTDEQVQTSDSEINADIKYNISQENNQIPLLSENSDNEGEKEDEIVTEEECDKPNWIKTEILQNSSSNFSLNLENIDKCSDEPPQQIFPVSSSNESSIKEKGNQMEFSLDYPEPQQSSDDLTSAKTREITTKVEENKTIEENNRTIYENDSKLSDRSSSASESEGDNYQIIEGLQNDENDSKETEIQKASLDVNDKPHIIKVFKSQQQSILMDNCVNKKTKNDSKDSKTPVFYLVKNTEKENVALLRSNSNKTYKVNPRSVLKTSFLQMKRQKKEGKFYVGVNEKKVPVVSDKIDKRFARNKEVIESIMFQNYIAKTTIPHAPVRQGKMPRKQKIRPVERSDEEIIIKEVAVSSQGFIEFPDDCLLPRGNVEIVQLSDSESNYCELNNGKKSKSQKKTKFTEIVISDSDSEDSKDEESDDDGKIIQIDLSADSEEDTAQVDPKRKRGRPRKSPKQMQNNEEKPQLSNDCDNNTNLKRKRGRPPKKITTLSEEKSTSQEVINL